MIELMYFAKYRDKAGFKFAIDGFYKLDEDRPLVCLFCLNPPAALYQDSIDAT